jgi:hypothetical protein
MRAIRALIGGKSESIFMVGGTAVTLWIFGFSLYIHICTTARTGRPSDVKFFFSHILDAVPEF